MFQFISYFYSLYIFTTNNKISAETLGMEGECVGMIPERKSSWLDVDSIGKNVRSPSPGPEDWRRKSISR